MADSEHDDSGMAPGTLEWIVTETPVVVYALRPDGWGVEPVWVCPNIERILAHSPRAPYQPAWWTETIHPEDRDKVTATRQRAKEHGTATSQYRVLDGHGDYRWVHDELRVASGGELVGAWTDVTEHRKVEDELQHRQKLSAMGQLAGGVAHDLNNLATAIMGSCSLLRERLSDDSALAELDTVMDATHQAAAITRQLLVFGRKQPLAPKATGLNTVVDQAIELLRHLLAEHYRIDKRLARPEPVVHVDASLLQQCIVNIALNARDAMPEGGTLTFETAVTGAGPQEATLTVRDTGTGMSAEVRDRVFEPFFTTKETGGSGLGLAMVYGFVQRSGGRIEIDSAPGSGTAVTLAFDSVDAQPETTAVDSSPSREPTAYTVLVAEDDDRVRHVMVRSLSADGYRVVEAPDGARALEIVRNGDVVPDLVVTDLTMPTMGGEELAARLRELVGELPVLFISGYAESWPAEDAAGPRSRFLPKPFTMDQLQAEVDALLSRPR